MFSRENSVPTASSSATVRTEPLATTSTESASASPASPVLSAKLPAQKASSEPVAPKSARVSTTKTATVPRASVDASDGPANSATSAVPVADSDCSAARNARVRDSSSPIRTLLAMRKPGSASAREGTRARTATSGHVRLTLLERIVPDSARASWRTL